MSDVSTKDIERFLAGELPSDSPEYEQIVEDLERPDGVVWQFFIAQRQQRLSILDDQLIEVMRDEAHSFLTSIAPTAPEPSAASPPSNEDGTTNFAAPEVGSPISIASHSDYLTSDPRTGRARRSRSWLTATVATVAIIGIAIFVSRTGPRRESLVASIDDPLGMVARDAAGGVHGLESFPQEWRSDIAVMLETGRVKASNISLDFRRGTRGSDAPVAYIQPNGTVVQTTTPQFQWKPLGNGVTYEVVIYATNDEQQPVSSGELTETSWTVPNSTPLRPGMVFEWEVVVRGDGPEHVPDEPRPRFKVIAVDTLMAVKAAEQTARGSHLVLTAAYLDAGLLQDAHRELSKLAAENPKSPIIHEWLKSLELQR